MSVRSPNASLTTSLAMLSHKPGGRTLRCRAWPACAPAYHMLTSRCASAGTYSNAWQVAMVFVDLPGGLQAEGGKAGRVKA